ncbi:Predicted PurR-regulated permease PerM [Paramicrobacterium humi]|uniref:Predicted PurR-regulated permease PerM n=1 Tax=Paramicrobacterium humi TaxID=640635 RepID=A0A1H4KMR6_9MICO|nr:AI-2E family transporter [Microbacterium humi]SEB59398.1 Predicted PurR-regulated permease PerM [Microbacterium humi]
MGLFVRASTAPESEEHPSIWRDGFGRLATRCVQILAVLAVTVVVVYALIQLKLILIPVLLALIFASAFNPLMRALRSRGVPSVLATIIALVSVLVIIGAVVWLVVWAVESQWDELVESASNGFTTLQEYFAHLPITIDQAQIDEWRDTAVGFLTSSQFGSGALAGVSATANFLTGLVLMVVVLFFFLKDGPKIWEFLLRPFVGKEYQRAIRIGDKTVDTLGGYARGTAIVAAVDAIGIGIGLLILQVPLAIPLAVIVFLTAFIPIVGATLAGILAALVALVTNGPVTALIVVGIVVLVNQLEGNFLQPVVMGRSLKLHALVILLALTAGTILGGIIGAVISVPTAAVAWGIVTVWNGENEPAKPMQQKRPEVT